MRKLLFLLTLSIFFGCGDTATDKGDTETKATAGTDTKVEKDFVWNTENFADIKMIRYQIPGFDKLTLKQKQLVYFLTQAGYAGRDIMWDMNYRHNLHIRRGIENILNNYKGDQTGADYMALVTYAKRMWFSSGIHHHYGNDKFIPAFSKEWFMSAMKETKTTISEEALTAIFDPNFDNKKINFDPSKDLIKGSAVNFYDPDLTLAEVDAFNKNLMKDKNPDKPVAYGLNSKIIRQKDGTLAEKVWHADGMYGESIKEIVKWLEKASSVAENKAQGDALNLLIKYYQTGDLKIWDDYNIAWLNATEGDIDYINSFIEVYQDPKGYKGSYESIVQIKDFDASARMSVVAENAQWFEDNSPIMDEHKKDSVKGISYKVVAVAGEAGDASPSTPIGVNLPNSDWIRVMGSKSVSLGNIIEAYSNADGPGLLKEFANDDEELQWAKAYSKLSGKMHTALHEVVGHASGRLEKGVATPKETLKSYASPLEEARADLVGLVYIMDKKLIDLGLMESLDVGKAQYDSYIRNGMMLQLRRIEPGKNIEQAHMRNRQMVANWAYQKGKKDKVIEKVKRGGKTYFNINDYEKLHALFAELLTEVQRIKSQGDYEAGKALIESYGVIVDKAIHMEVKARSEKLNIPPYGGFINPRLVPVMDKDGNITDVKVEYPDDFMGQMMEYADKYSFLPDYN